MLIIILLVLTPVASLSEIAGIQLNDMKLSVVQSLNYY